MTASVESTQSMSSLLSEREDVGADAGVEELDLECPIFDWPRLPNELIHTIVLQAPPSLGIHVDAMVRPRGGAIDLDAKANGAASGAGGQYEIEIAGVKAEGDAAGCIVQRGELAADRPGAGQAPVVERQRRCGAIDTGSIFVGAARRSEVYGLGIADVGLVGAQIVFIRRRLRTCAVDRHNRTGDGRAVGVGQQWLDQAPGFVVA